MTTFRHSNDFIWIDGVNFLLSEFRLDEPDYTLPPGAVERKYNGGSDFLLIDGVWVKGNNSIELDGYISKLTIYINAKEARRLKRVGLMFAGSLAEAKVKKKQQQKRIAINLFNEYVDSDLEITDIQKQKYKAALIAQKPIVGAEIDALLSVGEVAEYQYNGWPSP